MLDHSSFDREKLLITGLKDCQLHKYIRRSLRMEGGIVDIHQP